MPAITTNFTGDELLALVQKSEAIRKLTDKEKSEVQKLVLDPLSPQAKALYRALKKEQELKEKNQQEYIKRNTKVLENLQIKIRGMKEKFARDENQKAEHQATAGEEFEAEKMLRLL